MNIGFAGLLTLVFVVLKLIGTIAWSWWLVLAPLWVGALLLGVVFVALVAFARIKLWRMK